MVKITSGNAAIPAWHSNPATIPENNKRVFLIRVTPQTITQNPVKKKCTKKPVLLSTTVRMQIAGNM
jgi:hypothetical protein